MARQQKKLPTRRRNAADESLLIRSAESLGRVIGSLQRQLDAARRLVGPVSVDQRGNGHGPARQRSKARPAAKAKPPAQEKAAAGRRRPAASAASKKR